MKNKKRFGTGMAIIAAAGLLGATAYGIENLDTEKNTEDRITLDSAINLDEKNELDPAAVTAVSSEIDQIPLQQDSSQSLPNVSEVVKKVMPAIVAITNVGKEEINFFGQQFQRDSASTGSGIIVGKNDDELLIATNNHVVEGAEELTVCFSVDLDDGADEEDKLVSALIKGTDPSSDLAVVSVKLDDIKDDVADEIGIVQLGDSDQVEIGEWVVCIGNALGYGQSTTTGIVSALDREVTVETTDGTVTNNMIQTDAAINFGNSGGAMLDLNGRLIGINSAKAAVSGVEGMGYAIPINTAKPIIEDLMNQTTRSKVDDENAGALGVYVYNVSQEAQELYRVPAGALVTGFTDKNSPAAEAGIEKGDIITKLDETKITSRDQLTERLKYYEAGEKVTITLVHFEEDGGYVEKQYEVKLGKRSELPADSDESLSDSSDSGRNDSDGGHYGGYGLEDFFDSFGF